MEIVAALFVENIAFRQIPGPSTRIDLTGVYFSVPVASFPTNMEPHLVVLLRCPADGSGRGRLRTVFLRDGTEVAANAQEVEIEPGKFGYRLVRAELTFDAPGTVEAHCSVEGTSSTVTVPLTAMATA